MEGGRGERELFIYNLFEYRAVLSSGCRVYPICRHFLGAWFGTLLRCFAGYTDLVSEEDIGVVGSDGWDMRLFVLKGRGGFVGYLYM
jgi:hypothetical protein